MSESSQGQENGDLKAQVVKVLADEIGPALQIDGGAIEVVDVTDGVVRVRLGNICGGCPSTLMAVIMGIEQELRRHLAEVRYVETEY